MTSSLWVVVSSAMNGMGRYDLRLFTNYNNTTPVDAGARAAILGSLFVVTVTALMAIPMGIAAAVVNVKVAQLHNRLHGFASSR